MPDQWDLNVQAVQDAKAAIVDAKHEWTAALKERSRLLKPLLRKRDLTPADKRLIAKQDAIVRAIGDGVKAKREDLEAARVRFKNAEGC